jgi:hypothetical protein
MSFVGGQLVGLIAWAWLSHDERSRKGHLTLHESAHVVLGWYMPELNLRHVSMRETAMNAAYVLQTDKPHATLVSRFADDIVSMAGVMAEIRRFGSPDGGCESDLEEVIASANIAFPDDRAKNAVYLERVFEQTRRLVDLYWSDIERLATELDGSIGRKIGAREIRRFLGPRKGSGRMIDVRGHLPS